jgi:hypothetical protein
MTPTLSTVELYPEGSGTRLIFTDQSAFFGQETEADRREGWGEIFAVSRRTWTARTRERSIEHVPSCTTRR